MSDQSTPAGPTGGNERGSRLGRFRSKGAPAPGGAPAAQKGTDAVTGLPTREVLHQWLQAAILASRPTSSRTILVFVDLDSLRDVNDSFGPDAGDSLLAAGPRPVVRPRRPGPALRRSGAGHGVPGRRQHDRARRDRPCGPRPRHRPLRRARWAGSDHRRLPPRARHRRGRRRGRRRSRARRPPGPGARPRPRSRHLRRARRVPPRALHDARSTRRASSRPSTTTSSCCTTSRSCASTAAS